MKKLKERRQHRKQFWREVRSRIQRTLFRRHATVIAITGSCAKTSATKFLGRIVSNHAPSYIGIDRNASRSALKTMLRAPLNTRFFVQEVGISEPGHMAKSVRLLRPQIGIVTTIGQDHYTSFRTLEATAAEKGLLIEALPKSGTAALNADDPHVMGMAARTKASVITYGQTPDADLRAFAIKADWPNRLSFSMTYQGRTARVETDLFGDLMLTALLAAVAGGLSVGIPLEQCAESLKAVPAYPRRQFIHHSAQGMWFINDTFKAPWWSMEQVMNQLKHAKSPRKTIVIGSMSDTGPSGSRKYRQVARHALDIADRVVFVGNKAKHAKKVMPSEAPSNLFIFDSIVDAAEFLETSRIKDELILLKSNKLEHLERLVHIGTDQQKCWKERCDKVTYCDHCEEQQSPATR